MLVGATPFLGLLGREERRIVKIVSTIKDPPKRFKGHPKGLWPGMEKWFYNHYKNNSLFS